MKHLVVAVPLVLYASGALAASPPCGETQTVLKNLKDEFGEVPTIVATINDHVAIFTANPDTSTWTFVLQRQPGESCVVAAGENWGVVPPPKPGQGA